MSIRLSCSTCNTEFSLPELPPDRRASCPRCGDVFPVRAWQEELVAGARSAGTPSPAAQPLPSRRSRQIVRMLVFPLLMASLGLGVAVWVAHRQKPMLAPPKPQRPEGAVLPATQLEGLGYLPADTNIAFAVQPGAVVAYAKKTHQDVRELVSKMGIPARILDSLTRLGITLAQIDHIAGGTCVSDRAAELRLSFVLVLRRPPDDDDEFLHQLKAKHHGGEKDRYEVEFPGLPVTVAARVSPTIWVFGFDEKKDLEAVGKGYQPSGSQFPVGLAEMIAKQVPADAAAWVATNDETWAAKPGVELAIKFLKKPEWLPVLAQGRAGMAAITFGEQPRVRLYVKTADAATGQRVRNYFAERAGTDDKVQHGSDGESAFFDSPLDPANAFATIQQFLSDTAKK